MLYHVYALYSSNIIAKIEIRINKKYYFILFLFDVSLGLFWANCVHNSELGETIFMPVARSFI